MHTSHIDLYPQGNPPRLPRHIAIVMDGNGRWAKARSLPRTAGHRAGVRSVRSVTEACSRLGIEALTLFAFSSENWNRPASEVSLLMRLFMHTLRREARRLADNNVRLRMIGDRGQFSDSLQEQIARAEALTAHCTGLQLNIAASYGGRWDIARAARRLAAAVAAGELAVEQIDEARLGAQMCLADLPEPDLFIRTGGERRISNFLLWQMAYSELYFTDVSWPDFDDAALAEALADYARRERRFGKTSEQVGRPEHA